MLISFGGGGEKQPPWVGLGARSPQSALAGYRISNIIPFKISSDLGWWWGARINSPSSSCHFAPPPFSLASRDPCGEDSELLPSGGEHASRKTGNTFAVCRNVCVWGVLYPELWGVFILNVRHREKSYKNRMALCTVALVGQDFLSLSLYNSQGVEGGWQWQFTQEVQAACPLFMRKQTILKSLFPFFLEIVLSE